MRKMGHRQPYTKIEITEIVRLTGEGIEMAHKKRA